MTWTIGFDDALRLIRIVYSATLNPEDIEASAAEALSLARKHECRNILADCQELLNTNSMSTVHLLADRIAAMKSSSAVREALVLPAHPIAQEAVRFWENACRSRGLDVRTFADMPAAIEWLSAPHPA